TSEIQKMHPQRPPMVIAAKELMPSPEFEVPQQYSNLDENQQIGVALMMDAFNKGKAGFLLADGTGVGKTVQQLAVANEIQKQTGGKVLIITENDQDMQNYFRDKDIIGVNTDKFSFATYAQLSLGKVD